MRDRPEQILRIACLTLAALVVLQLVRAGFQASQLAGAKIPAVPTLDTNTNSTAGPASELKTQSTNLAAAKINKSGPTNSVAGQKTGETNSVSTNAVTQTAGGTNSVSTNSVADRIAPGTNSASTNSEAAQATLGTNSISTNPEPVQIAGGTNSVSTNAVAQITGATNSAQTNSEVAQSGSGTNSVSTNSEVAQVTGATNSVATNAVAPVAAGTNSISTNSEAMRIVGGTNLLSTNVIAQTATNKNPVAGTNSVAAATTNSSGRQLPPSRAGMPGMPGQPGSAPKLSPEIQARVDKIVSSEIFAPVMHPLPMGLLGIAGDTAFLRSATGQTGLVKPGDSLGDLKLLQIGINRVVVEQDGQKKELTIFNGFGSGSLLTNQDDTTNENIQLHKRAGSPGTN